MLRPIGIPRDARDPLPYVALHLELGNESSYRQSKSKIQVTVSEHGDVEFCTLVNKASTAEKELQEYRDKMKVEKKVEKKEADKKEVEKTMIKSLREEVKSARTKRDSYNRYSISVRGASPEVYGVLAKANIATEFATLLRVTMPSSDDQNSTIQQMRSLERLGDNCANMAWMLQYTAEDDGEESE